MRLACPALAAAVLTAAAVLLRASGLPLLYWPGAVAVTVLLASAAVVFASACLDVLRLAFRLARRLTR